jgi:hypothetical protein
MPKKGRQGNIPDLSGSYYSGKFHCMAMVATYTAAAQKTVGVCKAAAFHSMAK